MNILFMIWVLLCIYFLWRNYHVVKYYSWFIDECYDYCMKHDNSTHLAEINKIIGTYYYLAFSFRSFDNMILDRKKYDEILGEK